MIFHFNLVLRHVHVASIVFLFLAFFSSSAWAQANLNIERTEIPDRYVASLLAGIEENGMSVIRAEFEKMGLNTPQTEAAISIYEATQNLSDARWTEAIGVVRTGQALEQHYAYAYLGGNGWIFIRIDFVRRSANDWVLSSFIFNSEYAAILAPYFPVME